MNLQLLVPLLITTIVAIVGWFAVHQFSAARDRRNRLLDLKTEYLLSVHRRLERSVGKIVTRESADDIEQAIADLQLLGSPRQAHMARDYIKAWGGKDLGGISVGPLLEELRDSIRKDFDLEPIDKPIDHFRLHLHGESPDQIKPSGVGEPYASTAER